MNSTKENMEVKPEASFFVANRTQTKFFGYHQKYNGFNSVTHKLGKSTFLKIDK